MAWYPTFVFYVGIFDASILMLGGLVCALVILFGLDAGKLWGRTFPSVGAIIVSNIGAAIVLAGTRWLMG